MPAPPRPAGAIPPVDLLWRFELQQHNAALLQRMQALEANFQQQEQRTRKAEDAAVRYDMTADSIEQTHTAIDQLEARQQEFMDTVQKRLVSMDKDIGEIQKTQESVQKLMFSLRELDRAVGDLSLLSTRLDEVETDMRCGRDNVSLKCAQEVGKLETRLQALELQHLQGENAVSNLHDDLMRTMDDKIRMIRMEVSNLRGSNAPAASPSYVQVPHSPDMLARTTTTALHAARPYNRTLAVEPQHRLPQDQTPPVHREACPLQGTTQATTQEEVFEDLDLDLPVIPKVSLGSFAGQPRLIKRPRLSAPRPQLSDSRQQSSKATAEASTIAHGATKLATSSKVVVASKLIATSKSTTGPRSAPASNSTIASKSIASRKPTAFKSGIASGPTATSKPSKVVVLPLPKVMRKSEPPSSDAQSDNKPATAPPATQELRGKKRPGSPVSAPQLNDEGRSHPSTLSKQPRGSQASASKRENRKPGPSQPPQPTRISRRRAEQTSMYELDWKEQLRSQPKSGPAFPEAAPTRYRRRRLPPFPEEQYAA